MSWQHDTSRELTREDYDRFTSHWLVRRYGLAFLCVATGALGLALLVAATQLAPWLLQQAALMRHFLHYPGLSAWDVQNLGTMGAVTVIAFGVLSQRYPAWLSRAIAYLRLYKWQAWAVRHLVFSKAEFLLSSLAIRQAINLYTAALVPPGLPPVAGSALRHFMDDKLAMLLNASTSLVWFSIAVKLIRLPGGSLALRQGVYAAFLFGAAFPRIYVVLNRYNIDVWSALFFLVLRYPFVVLLLGTLMVHVPITVTRMLQRSRQPEYDAGSGSMRMRRSSIVTITVLALTTSFTVLWMRECGKQIGLQLLELYTPEAINGSYQMVNTGRLSIILAFIATTVAFWDALNILYRTSPFLLCDWSGPTVGPIRMRNPELWDAVLDCYNRNLQGLTSTSTAAIPVSARQTTRRGSSAAAAQQLRHFFQDNALLFAVPEVVETLRDLWAKTRSVAFTTRLRFEMTNTMVNLHLKPLRLCVYLLLENSASQNTFMHSWFHKKRVVPFITLATRSVELKKAAQPQPLELDTEISIHTAVFKDVIASAASLSGLRVELAAESSFLPFAFRIPLFEKTRSGVVCPSQQGSEGNVNELAEHGVALLQEVSRDLSAMLDKELQQSGPQAAPYISSYMQSMESLLKNAQSGMYYSLPLNLLQSGYFFVRAIDASRPYSGDNATRALLLKTLQRVVQAQGSITLSKLLQGSNDELYAVFSVFAVLGLQVWWFPESLARLTQQWLGVVEDAEPWNNEGSTDLSTAALQEPPQAQVPMKQQHPIGQEAKEEVARLGTRVEIEMEVEEDEEKGNGNGSASAKTGDIDASGIYGGAAAETADRPPGALPGSVWHRDGSDGAVTDSSSVHALSSGSASDDPMTPEEGTADLRRTTGVDAQEGARQASSGTRCSTHNSEPCRGDKRLSNDKLPDEEWGKGERGTASVDAAADNDESDDPISGNNVLSARADVGTGSVDHCDGKDKCEEKKWEEDRVSSAWGRWRSASTHSPGLAAAAADDSVWLRQEKTAPSALPPSASSASSTDSAAQLEEEVDDDDDSGLQHVLPSTHAADGEAGLTEDVGNHAGSDELEEEAEGRAGDGKGAFEFEIGDESKDEAMSEEGNWHARPMIPAATLGTTAPSGSKADTVPQAVPLPLPRAAQVTDADSEGFASLSSEDHDSSGGMRALQDAMVFGHVHPPLTHSDDMGGYSSEEESLSDAYHMPPNTAPSLAAPSSNGAMAHEAAWYGVRHGSAEALHSLLPQGALVRGGSDGYDGDGENDDDDNEARVQRVYKGVASEEEEEEKEKSGGFTHEDPLSPPESNAPTPPFKRAPTAGVPLTSGSSFNSGPSSSNSHGALSHRTAASPRPLRIGAPAAPKSPGRRSGDSPLPLSRSTSSGADTPPATYPQEGASIALRHVPAGSTGGRGGGRRRGDSGQLLEAPRRAPSLLPGDATALVRNSSAEPFNAAMPSTGEGKAAEGQPEK